MSEPRGRPKMGRVVAPGGAMAVTAPLSTMAWAAAATPP